MLALEPVEPVRVPLPTQFGVFDVRAFEFESGHVYVAMVLGELGGSDPMLVRLHSECLTGDVLGSLRCDCGIQLRLAMRTIAAEGRGILIYATGHEGRGIGLVNKLRAYAVQDAGADTVDANTALGLPVDGRDYSGCAAVLAELGIDRVRLLTNNPLKVAALRRAGISVEAVVPLATAPHHRNAGYLETKTRRLEHVQPTGAGLPSLDGAEAPLDAMELLGPVRPHHDRPFVALKFAQTLDGRIATSSGDARWISGEAERRISHALRAACDAVMVGIGTVVQDDPQLTVRMVPGASPTRIVLDTTLRIPDSAKLLQPEAPTIVFTTDRSDPRRRDDLRRRGIRVDVVAEEDGRVSIGAALAVLRAGGTESVLVEGGGRVLTGLLAGRHVDRIIVGIAPVVIGSGTEAVGELGVRRVADGIRLTNRTVVPIEDDVLLAWDVDNDAASASP